MLVYVTLHTNPLTYAYTVTVVILTNVFSQILCVMKVCIITGNELTMNSSQLMYMIVYMHVYMHVYVSTCIHACICIYMHTYIHTYVCDVIMYHYSISMVKPLVRASTVGASFVSGRSSAHHVDNPHLAAIDLGDREAKTRWSFRVSISSSKFTTTQTRLGTQP